MSSEQLADGVNPLDAELAATWDVLKGYSGRDTDLGIARRFGGAAAAYSLRNIGTDGLPVVKVRRDVDGQGSDPEEDFSAHRVQSGGLEDWVNGKLESTLPADVATAAAAYSLRKVKANYTGYAVRIRRTVDNTEVNVAFDSEDKVSLNSTIVVITGSTDATTLGEFLTEDSINYNAFVHTWYDQTKDLTELSTYFNATLSSSNFAVNAMTEEFGTYFGRDNAVKLTSTGGNTQRFDSIDFGIGAGESVRFTAQIYVPSTNTALDSFAYSEKFDVSGYDRKQGVITPTQDQWVDIDFNYIQSDDTIQRIIFWNSASATPTANNVSDGDVIYFRNMVVTRVTKAQANAVQTTAANQPQIADTGVLLADGLTFDGSNDFLQTSTQVLTGTETGANSMYAVIKQTSGDAGYICGSAGTGGTGSRVGQSLYGATNDKIVLTDGQDATATGTLDTITRIEGSNYLISVNYSNNNTDTLHSNSNANGYANGSSAYAFSAGTKFTIGARDGSTAEAVLFDGSMKEVIAYDSDQSNNRFKIESNINNYYGLYNDANEFASNETSFRFLNERSGGISASSDLTQFTLDVQTSSGYAGAKLSSDVLSGDAIYVSFNCSFDSGSPSPKIALRDIDSTLAGGVDSNEENVVEGFNSFTLTSTDSNASGIVWSEGDDNVIFSVTDFKVSRIARNGFVETWYDQSGNNRPMIQDNASEQPSIVENGGFLGGVKAKKATSDDTMQNLQVSTNGVSANFGTNDWASGANSKLGLMYVGKIDDVAVSTTQSVIWGGGRGVSSFQSGGLSLQVVKGGDDNYSLTNERQGLSPTIMSTTITLNTDDDMILYGTADNREFTLKLNSTTATDTETADLDTREDQAISLFGAYSGFNTRRYQNSSGGVCKECYLFAGDNISEVDTIATEINQHYNIY